MPVWEVAFLACLWCPCVQFQAHKDLGLTVYLPRRTMGGHPLSFLETPSLGLELLLFFGCCLDGEEGTVHIIQGQLGAGRHVSFAVFCLEP